MGKYQVILKGFQDQTPEVETQFFEEFGQRYKITAQRARELVRQKQGSIYSFDDLSKAEKAKAFLDSLGGVAEIEGEDFVPPTPPADSENDPSETLKEKKSCPKCGNQVPASQDQCPYCQIFLSKYYLMKERKTESLYTPAEPAGGHVSEKREKKSNTKRFVIILGSIIITLGVGYHFLSARGLHKGFSVARLTVKSSGETDTGSWQQSSEVAPKNRIKVMVAASWCGYCQNDISKMGNRAKVDMILFYEDEVERLIQRQLQKGQISPSDLDEIRQQFSSKGQILISPDKLAPYDLPYYLIKSGQFEELVQGYPTYLSCDPRGCRKIGPP